MGSVALRPFHPGVIVEPQTVVLQDNPEGLLLILQLLLLPLSSLVEDLSSDEVSSGFWLFRH